MRKEKQEILTVPQFYDCQVIEASALQVVWGINEGDLLGLPDSLCLGDMYSLRPDATPIHLRLQIDAKTCLATDQPATIEGLRPGATVTIQAELRLMSNDGDMVSALLLHCDTRILLLPLTPMRVGVRYALIELDTGVEYLRMTELVRGCFATGARVTMEDGSLCPVEALSPGMQLRTRDHGPQTLRWVGQVTQRAHGVFAPVTFTPGTLGNLGPLSLGPLQRIFLYQRGEGRLGGRPEILVQAQSLVDGVRVLQREGGFVTYFSLVFDQHQIIYVEGIPVESMLVSRATVARLPKALAQDLEQRFPHLNQHAHFAQDMPSADVTEDIRASLLQQKER